MTGRVQDWNRQSMKKDGGSAPQHGVRSTGSLFHSSAPVMLADGGSVDEAAMKQRGLDASNKEKPTGFFQRLREGSIDDPSSMAYKKYGAGRGRMEGEMDKAEAEMKANQANARSGSQAMRDDADFDAVGKSFSGARAVAGAPAPVEVTPVRSSRVQVTRVEVPTPSAMNAGRGNRSPGANTLGDTSTSRGNRSPGANTLPAAAPAPAATAKPKTGYQAQVDRDEQRRDERRAAGRAAGEQAATKREADRVAFNQSVRSDPAQEKIRAERKARENMSPAERSQERGRRLKEMLGIR
jgi:hypothetical protein